MAQFNKNIPFNKLPKLPPKEAKILSKSVLLKLTETIRALATLNGYIKAQPFIEMHLNALAVGESLYSSAIDAPMVSQENFLLELSTTDTKTPAALKMPVNYYKILTAPEFANDGLIDFCEDLIRSAYISLVGKDGFYRKSGKTKALRKGGGGIDSTQVVYTPPDGEETIASLMNNLIAFVNDVDNSELDPLLKTIIAHYQFEAIHPYDRGNGVIGRLLMHFMLKQAGLLEYPILVLSKFLYANKTAYFQYLNSISATGNWQNWILFMLNAIKESAENAFNKMQEINNVFLESKRAVLTAFPKMETSVPVLVFSRPSLKAIHIVGEQVKSRNTATKYLKQLCDLKILEPKRLSKENLYINKVLLPIL